MSLRTEFFVHFVQFSVVSVPKNSNITTIFYVIVFFIVTSYWSRAQSASVTSLWYYCIENNKNIGPRLFGHPVATSMWHVCVKAVHVSSVSKEQDGDEYTIRPKYYYISSLIYYYYYYTIRRQWAVRFSTPFG